MTGPATHPTSGPAALFSGGGSGGHVFPGLAVAEELARRGWRPAWAGSEGGLEGRLLADRLPYYPLAARPVVGQGIAGKLAAAATLLRSAWRARTLLRRLGAKVIVGTGGYASAPAVVAARLAVRRRRRTPVLLIEPNAEPGLANRLLSRLAAEAAVAGEAVAGLTCPIRATGVPVRREFSAVPEELPPSPPWRLLVLGGSQGAQQLNQTVPAALGLLRRRGEIADAIVDGLVICHQTGERNLESTREAYRKAGLEPEGADLGKAEGPADGRNGRNGHDGRHGRHGHVRAVEFGSPERKAKPVGPDRVQPSPAPEPEPAAPTAPTAGVPAVSVIPFLQDVAGAMAKSHLVLSRAGAITLAEICAAGRPSLLLPLTLAGGHQAANARRLAAAGAAEVLASSAGAEELATALAGLLEERRLQEMARAARRLGRPDAAKAIADRVELLAGEGGKI